TLSRTEEECHPTVRGVRAGESVLGAEKTVALGTGLARERRLLITGEPPKQAEDRKKPNPSACTGLAEHLLPRRHGLIQSFPRATPSARRSRMWYWPWTSQNRPVNLSAKGVTRFAAKPIISDTSSEPVVLPSVFILRPGTERQSVPRSLGGSAPSHVPAA